MAVLAVLVAIPLLVAPDPATGDGTMAVTVTVNGSGSSTEQVRVPVNASAFQALNASHAVNHTAYSNGLFVTGIDGVQQNETHSWLYLVNGSVPSVAVDRVTLDAGTHVTFAYLPNEKALNMTG